jgi:hypothetical protein
MTRWYWLLISFVDHAFAAPNPAFLGVNRFGSNVPSGNPAQLAPDPGPHVSELRTVWSVGLL